MRQGFSPCDELKEKGNPFVICKACTRPQIKWGSTRLPFNEKMSHEREFQECTRMLIVLEVDNKNVMKILRALTLTSENERGL